MIARLFEIRCDRCHAGAGVAETVGKAKAAARSAGFTNTNGGKTRCGACLAADVRRALAAAGERG